MEDKYIISYAQNREDIILANFFPGLDKGFYVDVGANHPTKESVTKYFYEKGWRGINIEPTKRLFDLLAADRPLDQNVQCGISNHSGEINFREYTKGDGLSTFSTDMQQLYEKTKDNFTKEYKEYPVHVTTLRELFNRLDVKIIHFLKIDIEGYEYEALDGNDWKVHRPKMICIESNHITRDWRPFLKKQGYKNVFNDGLNNYYVDENAVGGIQEFSYPNAILMGPKVISWPLHNRLVDNDRKSRYLNFELRRTNQFNKILNDRLDTILNSNKNKLQSDVMGILRHCNALIRQKIDAYEDVTPMKPMQSVIAKTRLPQELQTELTKSYNRDTSLYKTFKRGLLKISYRLLRGIALLILKTARVIKSKIGRQ